jgi:hypothetical protein
MSTHRFFRVERWARKSNVHTTCSPPRHEEIHQGVAALAEICREFGVPARGPESGPTR